MSEKVTFGELIESIAEETDHSKQFTHDFLKDFVEVINGGLEEDGKVNIAGFGKFELRRVDEREGYNPQTEEKITIPAHNKIVFKPYKDLRELVNAPYAHMEPKLIDEKNESTDDELSSPDQQVIDSQTEEPGVKSDKSTDTEIEQSGQEQQSDPDITESPEEKEHNEDDFIPTAPPTSHVQDSDEDETNGEDQAEASQKAPFDLENDDEDSDGKQSQAATPDSDDDGDIVEFGADQSDKEESDDETLNEFIGLEQEQQSDIVDDSASEKEDDEIFQDSENKSDDAVTNEEDDKKTEPEKSEEEVLAEEVEKLEQTATELKENQSDNEGQQDVGKTYPELNSESPTDKPRVFPYVAAAVLALLLISGGVWYFTTQSTNDTTLASSEEITTTNDGTDQQLADNQEAADEQENVNPQQADQNQGQTAANSSVATPSPTVARSNNQAVQIEEGQTLWSLAEERYGNPRLWPWIYGNNGSLQDPDIIYAGSSLSVPLPSGPQNTLNQADSVGVAKGFLATYKWYKGNEETKAKDHLWAAKLYHNDLQQLADVPIDKTDLTYANTAR